MPRISSILNSARTPAARIFAPAIPKISSRGRAGKDLRGQVGAVQIAGGLAGDDHDPAPRLRLRAPANGLLFAQLHGLRIVIEKRHWYHRAGFMRSPGIGHYQG